jgi:demethylphylloquinone reductase
MSTICILGGGFAGLYTALSLHRLDWGTQQRKIILVDKSDRFVFTPLLYELLTEEMADWEIAPAFRDLLKGTDIEFRQAAVGVPWPWMMIRPLVTTICCWVWAVRRLRR